MSGEIPWWALSPNPMTLFQWLTLTTYGTWRLYSVYGDKNRKLRSVAYWFTEAAFALGIIVLAGDALWCVLNGIRFGALFPFYPDQFQLVMALVRDVAGLILSYILVRWMFQNGVITYWTPRVILGWALNFAGLLLWFLLAPGMKWIDWHYAIRNGYPWSQVQTTFLIGHVILRLPIAYIYVSMWRRPIRS